MISKRATAIAIVGILIMAGGAAAGEDAAAAVEGFLTANGEKVELPHAYAYREEGGYYDEDDPTWTLLYVDRPIEEAALDDLIWDAA